MPKWACGGWSWRREPCAWPKELFQALSRNLGAVPNLASPPGLSSWEYGRKGFGHMGLLQAISEGCGQAPSAQGDFALYSPPEMLPLIPSA